MLTSHLPLPRDVLATSTTSRRVKLEVVTQLAPDCRFDHRESRPVEVGTGYVSQLGNARLLLEELKGVDIVKTGVVHVEGCERDPATGPRDKEFLRTTFDCLHRRPGEIPSDRPAPDHGRARSHPSDI